MHNVMIHYILGNDDANSLVNILPDTVTTFFSYENFKYLLS